MDPKPNEYVPALRAREGDREALAALVERTRLRLFALAYAEQRHNNEEARRLNDNYLGAEHLLLGFLREGYGLAARVLINLGADLERTRQEVVAMRAERA